MHGPLTSPPLHGRPKGSRSTGMRRQTHASSSHVPVGRVLERQNGATRSPNLISPLEEDALDVVHSGLLILDHLLLDGNHILDHLLLDGNHILDYLLLDGNHIL